MWDTLAAGDFAHGSARRRSRRRARGISPHDSACSRWRSAPIVATLQTLRESANVPRDVGSARTGWPRVPGGGPA